LDDLDAAAYDLALLPFDSRVLAPGRRPWAGTALFRALLELARDLPRAAVCFDAPPAPGREGDEGAAAALDALRRELADIPVVCASHQARQAWGFAASTVIWPGVSPLEFPPGDNAKACLTLPRRDMEAAPLAAGEAVGRRVAELVREVCAVDALDVPPPPPGYEPGSPEWSMAAFQNYARTLGQYAVYLNPTVDVPMPRRRLEAMVAGAIPVSLRNHDVDLFIQSGVNGFYADSAEELAEQVRWLVQNPRGREAIRRQAVTTAMDIGNVDRHLAAWADLLAKL
jgi:hypothetical protein